MSKFEQIEALVAASLSGDEETFLAGLHEDIVYHYHVGSRALEGKEWVRKFLHKYREFARDVKWRIDRYAETGDEVFVEGYEEYFDTRTNQVFAHPYMGIFEFKDGKVIGWRDYFEMNTLKE